MKKVAILIAVVGLVLSPLAASAGLIPEVEMEAGLEIGDFHYRESHIMREDGVPGGRSGSPGGIGAGNDGNVGRACEDALRIGP